MSVVLVTGPTRSGKSEWAETLATRSQKPVVYIATAQDYPDDLEWQARISRHQQRRSPQWKTQSVPLHLTAALRASSDHECLLIDALGTWLANWLEYDEATWEARVVEMLTWLQTTERDVILVGEEVGWGVVPAYPLGRLFRDRLGNLTRRVGAIADVVYLVTAGYVLNLSQLGSPLEQELKDSRSDSPSTDEATEQLKE